MKSKREERRKILKKVLIEFWKDSGKEWCGQYMNNYEWKEHEGFKLCLEEKSDLALSDLAALDSPIKDIKFVKPKKCAILPEAKFDRDKLEAELFRLEQKLNIPYKDRFYNKKNSPIEDKEK